MEKQSFFRSICALAIPWVYLTLSLEECVRLAISLTVFERRSWMNQLKA